MLTAEQLRSSILQLAMQGKLVDQRAEEGTGESVYLKLKQEQKELIASGRIKEKNLLGEIEVEEIEYDLPDTWTWARIEECGYFISGYTPKSSQLCNTGIIPYFKVSDMNTPGNETYLSFTEQYLSPEINQPRVFEAGTIVYPKNGGAVFTNKKRILAQSSIVDLNTGGFKPSNNIDPEYAFLLYSTIDFRQCYKGTALPTIDMEKLRRKIFPIPPIGEQKRIVAKIEKLMPLVEQYAEAGANLNTLNASFPDMMKKSILQEAVRGKLVPQDSNDEPASELLKRIAEEKKRLTKDGKIKKQKSLPEITEDEVPFDIPDSWEWVRLGSILNLLTDGTHKTPHYTSVGIPFISVKDMSSGIISFNNTKFISEEEADQLNARCNPEKGDVLLSKVGTTGVPAPVDTDIKFSLFVSVALLKFNTELINRDYLINVILSPCVQKQCAENTRGVGNKNWVMRDISNTLIPLAPLKEQARIVAELQRILPLFSDLGQRIKKDTHFKTP